MSRNRLQGLIAEGCVVSKCAIITDASAKVKPGQEFTLNIPEIAPSHIVAQEMALDIIFEDEHMLILNKPAGLTVHPAPGHPDRTLVNALLAHCGSSLSGIGGIARPGIVHRIDKETSGLLAVAKHDAAHAALSLQLSAHTMKRTYLALVWGTPKAAQGTITGNIGRSPRNRQKMAVVTKGGKVATTHYKILKNYSSLFSLMECRLETGRTHQIRVHLSHIGNPLVGDPVYGQTTNSRLHSSIYKSLPDRARAALLAFQRQALHATALELTHPATQKSMRFACDIPEDMQSLLKALQ
jgi:23S rRNA pseudouridine1911/1915/1917 synthase